MRARNIKPGFYTNEYLTNLDPLVRLLFTGLWCLADREGRLEDRPGKIKIAVLPCDDCDVDRILEDLARPQGPDGEHFIRRYVVEGKRCIQVLNFVRHQNPHVREAASVLPAPTVDADATPQASDSSNLHQESTVLATEEVWASPADFLIPDSPSLIPDSLIPDSPFLIPDSPFLIPDSPFLIPDSPLRIASAEKPSTEKGVGGGFISPRPSKNPQPTSTGKEDTGMVRVGDLIRARCESPPARQPPPAKKACDEECDQIYPPEFTSFWQLYPCSIGKKEAFRAWQRRLEEGVDTRDLIRAAQHYAAHCRRRRTDREYIKHPSTFLGPLEVYRDWVATLYKAGRSRNDWRPDYEEDLNLLSF